MEQFEKIDQYKAIINDIDLDLEDHIALIEAIKEHCEKWLNHLKGKMPYVNCPK